MEVQDIMASICQTKVVVPQLFPCPQIAIEISAEISPNSQEDIAVQAKHERVDQIPLAPVPGQQSQGLSLGSGTGVLRLLIEMGVPGIIDQHYTPHGNHQGLSVGWLATIFLVYIITESNHKMVYSERS